MVTTHPDATPVITIDLEGEFWKVRDAIVEHQRSGRPVSPEMEQAYRDLSIRRSKAGSAAWNATVEKSRALSQIGVRANAAAKNQAQARKAPCGECFMVHAGECP